MRTAAAVVLTTIATAATAGESILGVPFASDKFAVTAVCPWDADRSKRPCWVGPPFKSPDGSLGGSIHLPNADQRPKWAVHALFRINLDKNGRVQRLDVEASSSDLEHIVDSISSRFGTPSPGPMNMPPRYFHAKWKNATAAVDMTCSKECSVSFISAATQAEIAKGVAERSAKDAARPKAP